MWRRPLCILLRDLRLEMKARTPTTRFSRLGYREVFKHFKDAFAVAHQSRVGAAKCPSKSYYLELVSA